jgi:hypothetical protein
MNPLLQCKPTILPLFIAGVLACFGLLPKALAVVPPPDGGYPGGNTAEGQDALLSLTTGGFNTAVGFLSLRNDIAGGFNTAIGAGALLANTADQNTATGAGALLSNTTGQFNTAVGVLALFLNTTGFNNTATGQGTLFNNITGSFNAATGSGALGGNTSGGNNTAIGNSALTNNTTGSGDTVLGAGAGGNVMTADNVICIGANVGGADVSGTCFIGSIRGVTTINNDAMPVFIDSVGQLGTASSSRRFKRDINPIDNASEAILALKPVSFAYKTHKDNTPQFGLIAEDVAELNPDLVIYDTEGKPYAVRYDSVNAMLLNEFLKEHRAFLEEQCKVERLEEQVAALTAGLQKVSAQLELNKLAPQIVKNTD